MTCSRCSRRPGDRASTLTKEAAWRRDQLSGGTGTSSTATSNPPSNLMLTVMAVRPLDDGFTLRGASARRKDRRMGQPCPWIRERVQVIHLVAHRGADPPHQ